MEPMTDDPDPQVEETDRQVDEPDHLVDEPDPQEAIERIAARGEQIRQRELETAIDRLEAHGNLTADQRRAVEHLSTAIVEELLAVPTEAIEGAPAGDESLAVSLRLFGPEGE